MTTRSRARTRIRRMQHNLRLTKPIVLLAVGILLPVVLSTTVGIIAIILGESSKDLILGIMYVCLASAGVGSAIILTVLLGRRARTARLQSDLLGNVTHDLKTPLAAIRMYAQTLQTGALDNDPVKVRQCADTIARETEWLGAMIERLLTWRTAARDRDNLELVVAPIAELAEELAARFSRMLPPGEVDFKTSTTTSVPVEHDRSGIGSIVLNLLNNAYKYTGDRKAIELVVQDVDGGVEISVRDNGVGIPRREAKRIFEPFHRVDGGREFRAAGAGLGLAIVDFMVKAHSGTISVESKEGRGTVFTVFIPAAHGPEGQN